MNDQSQTEFRWLLSSDATPLLIMAEEMLSQRVSSLTIAKRLRKKVTPERSAMIIEQALLRIRARKKFPYSSDMFFTRRGYEQSTNTAIANYKAARFAGQKHVVDVCCGIGGDLISLAGRAEGQSTCGVDCDPLTVLFAERNLKAMGVKGEILCQDFESTDLAPYSAIHIDPDRRAKDRTIRGDNFKPSMTDVLQRMDKSPNLCVKVAPATPRPEGLPEETEVEWIGYDRECKQQIYWMGELAKNPGNRTATVIGKNGRIETISVDQAEMDVTIETSASIGDYFFEPHSAVLAAGLADVLGSQNGLNRISRGIHYLTGNDRVDNLLLAQFETLEILPMDLRRTVEELKRVDIGHFEVKNRGVEQVVVNKFIRLKATGSKKATIFLTRHAKQHIAIITKRVRRPG